jgi:2-haloacid dehalogenase
MLNALMDAAELHPYFQGVVSVDEVKAYKPSPKAYRHTSQSG